MNKDVVITLLYSTVVAICVIVYCKPKTASSDCGVCWLSGEVFQWNNTKGEKVGRIKFGLREDGTVVWKEEVVTWKEVSCITFGDTNTNNVGKTFRVDFKDGKH